MLPYSQFLRWVVTHHGVPLGLFVRELFANRVGAFFGMDVLASAVVLISFVQREGKRLGVRHLWLPIVGTLAVSVSLGFPLFLYLREGALERGPANSLFLKEASYFRAMASELRRGLDTMSLLSAPTRANHPRI